MQIEGQKFFGLRYCVSGTRMNRRRLRTIASEHTIWLPGKLFNSGRLATQYFFVFLLGY
jgi:hypothetical protein